MTCRTCNQESNQTVVNLLWQILNILFCFFRETSLDIWPCLRSWRRGWSLLEIWAAVWLRCSGRNPSLWCWTPPQTPAGLRHKQSQCSNDTLSLTSGYLYVCMCVSYLVCIVREVDFVEDLGCLMLDGFYFHQMRGILPGSVTVTMKTMTKRQQNERSVQLCCVSETIRSCELSFEFKISFNLSGTSYWQTVSSFTTFQSLFSFFFLMPL